MPTRFVAAALLAGAILAPAAASAQTFAEAPISCGAMVQYKGCTADFDGRTLRVTYTPPEGKPSFAVYTHCTATAQIIHCAVGKWQSEVGSVQLGARSIGLRDNLPFKN